MSLRVGADPEFFVRRRRHFVSGHTVPCGPKWEPQPTEYGHIQNDGVALECNVKPADTAADFVRNVSGVMEDLRFFMKKTDPSLELVARPSIFLGQHVLNKLPPPVRTLGCNADFDAYDMRENKAPDAEIPFRTAAGHVHLGWTEDADEYSVSHMKVCFNIVRELDYYLGLPSLLLDKDTRRRTLYGKAGAFRPKPYGLEYRVLSNFWTTDEGLMEFVFNNTHKAFRAAAKKQMFSRFGSFARECINNSVADWHEHTPELHAEVM